METAFKAKGTELLKSQKYIQAIDKYTQALNIMNEKINRNQVKTQKQMFDLIENIKLPCLKNISLCYMKLKQYADCIISCDLVLEIDSECDKTFYRKASCLIELEQFKDADEALGHAETINPDSKEIKLLREKWVERKDRSVRNEEEKQKVGGSSGEQSINSKTLVATIINLILYWIMLPLRWSQYVLSFIKKTTKQGYAKGIKVYAANILNWASTLLTSILDRIKQTFVTLKQKSLLKVNDLVRKLVGPFNQLSLKYLNLSIPFYRCLSGQDNSKPVSQPIRTQPQSS